MFDTSNKVFFNSILFYTYLKKNNEGFIGDSQILWQLEKHLRNKNLILIYLCILTEKVSVCKYKTTHVHAHFGLCTLV